jgi:hypothetical protein
MKLRLRLTRLLDHMLRRRRRWCCCCCCCIHRFMLVAHVANQRTQSTHDGGFLRVLDAIRHAGFVGDA